MHKYQNITTKEIKTYSEVRELSKNVSYPKSGGELLGKEWKLIKETPTPAYNELTEKVVEGEPQGFKQTWVVVPLPQSEINKIALRGVDRKWEKYKRDKDQHDKKQWELDGQPEFTIV